MTTLASGMITTTSGKEYTVTLLVDNEAYCQDLYVVFDEMIDDTTLLNDLKVSEAILKLLQSAGYPGKTTFNRGELGAQSEWVLMYETTKEFSKWLKTKGIKLLK